MRRRRPWSFVLGTWSVLGPRSGLGPESMVRALNGRPWSRVRGPRTKDQGPSDGPGTKNQGPGTCSPTVHSAVEFPVDGKIRALIGERRRQPLVEVDAEAGFVAGMHEAALEGVRVWKHQ